MIKQKDDAFNASVAALQIHPTLDDNKRLLVHILLDEGNYADAKKIVEAACLMNPNDVDFLELKSILSPIVEETNNNMAQIEQDELIQRLATAQRVAATVHSSFGFRI